MSQEAGRGLRAIKHGGWHRDTPLACPAAHAGPETRPPPGGGQASAAAGREGWACVPSRAGSPGPAEPPPTNQPTNQGQPSPPAHPASLRHPPRVGAAVQPRLHIVPIKPATRGTHKPKVAAAADGHCSGRCLGRPRPRARPRQLLGRRAQHVLPQAKVLHGRREGAGAGGGGPGAGGSGPSVRAGGGGKAPSRAPHGPHLPVGIGSKGSPCKAGARRKTSMLPRKIMLPPLPLPLAPRKKAHATQPSALKQVRPQTLTCSRQT